MKQTINSIIRNLHPKQLHKSNWSLDNPMQGHCYHASAALKILYPEINLHVGKWNGEIHWWNSDNNGNIIDITATQYDKRFPYHKGRIWDKQIPYTTPLKKLLIAIRNDNKIKYW